MSEERRKRLQRIYLENELKSLLRLAKAGCKYSFGLDFMRLRGTVSYMELVEDISAENGAKVIKLARTIGKSYEISCY